MAAVRPAKPPPTTRMELDILDILLRCSAVAPLRGGAHACPVVWDCRAAQLRAKGALPRGAYSKARRGACMSHTRRAEKNGVA